MARGNTMMCATISFILVFMVLSGSNGDLDVGFILDGSGSINDADKDNWGRLLNFISQVVKQLPEQGTQVGVVVFSLTAELRIKLDKYPERQELINAINQLQYPGSGTNTPGGLHVARTKLFNEHNGDRANSPNVAVLITDGESTEDTVNTIPNAEELHRDGIRVICVGIGTVLNEAEIRAISSPPHEKDKDYFILESFFYLHGFITTLAENIKQSQVELNTQSSSHSRENKDEEESTGINLLIIIIPIVIGIVIVVLIIAIICVVRRRKLAETQAGVDDLRSTTKVDNLYTNQEVKKGDQKDGIVKFGIQGGPPMYEEAAPAILYDDATSVATHFKQPKPLPALSPYETVGSEPLPLDTYDTIEGVIRNKDNDIKGKSKPHYDDVALEAPGIRRPKSPQGLSPYETVGVHPPDTYDNVDGATGGKDNEEKGKRGSNLYASVQRRASIIYAQVQKKKSYIYAQVNKRRK